MPLNYDILAFEAVGRVNNLFNSRTEALAGLKKSIDDSTVANASFQLVTRDSLAALVDAVNVNGANNTNTILETLNRPRNKIILRDSKDRISGIKET